ncbi:hypothetical protein MCUN1_002723 [Malassezia cuniculi]|uniref:DUF3533 domain-containing protein n=1 Tax=Malassezia cuniculi TaxID=948313 RepID=A0AAF0EVK2_9BASI|nr:hypothetical protein MCUN1_002723 [Malassezia cuniculi]
MHILGARRPSFATAPERRPSSHSAPSIAPSTRSRRSSHQFVLRDNESIIHPPEPYDPDDKDTQDDPDLKLFAYPFWAPELADVRKAYLIPVAMVTTFMCIVVWLFFGLYWASLFNVSDRAANLSGWIINRDNSTIGNALQDALLAASGNRTVSWSSRDPALYPSPADVMHAVDPNYDTWIVVDIAAGATDALRRAQLSADPAWDPASVVAMYYSDARSYQTYPGMIISPTNAILAAASTRVVRQLAQQTFANNASALAATLRDAPHTLIGALDVRAVNMHPWNNPVAIAPTFVGMIYLLILAFQVTMASFMSRQAIKNHLTFRAYLAMRFCTPAVAYIFISLMVSLINIAFELPYGASFSYGAGFMIWWCLSYTGMLVCGLALESVITIIGPKFIGIFLIFFIISNVSVANYPPEVMNRFFHYAYAMPFYQMRQVYTTILFDTGKHIYILKYFGILWAWMALILLTMPFIVWIDYNRVRHSRLHGDGTAPSH